MQLIDVLREAMPEATIRRGRGTVSIADLGTEHTFRVIEGWDPDAPPAGVTALVFVEDPMPRVVTALKLRGNCFATVAGQVWIRVPGLYVDIRPARLGLLGDRTRNPFSPRGRMICVRLLGQPDRVWQVTDLAVTTGVSQGFASRIVNGLVELGYARREHGRVVVEPEPLFAALAQAWPSASAFFSSRPLTPSEAVLSGGAAYEALGLALPGRPRAYVADRAQLRALAARANAKPVPSRMADWEAVIQPLHVENGLAPALVCALELARDTRGREVLRSHTLVQWAVHG